VAALKSVLPCWTLRPALRCCLMAATLPGCVLAQGACGRYGRVHVDTLYSDMMLCAGCLMMHMLDWPDAAYATYPRWSGDDAHARFAR